MRLGKLKLAARPVALELTDGLAGKRRNETIVGNVSKKAFRYIRICLLYFQVCLPLLFAEGCIDGDVGMR